VEARETLSVSFRQGSVACPPAQAAYKDKDERGRISGAKHRKLGYPLQSFASQKDFRFYPLRISEGPFSPV
jgi:hypothetical protein